LATTEKQSYFGKAETLSMLRPKIFLLVDDDADDHELFTEALQHVEKTAICFSAYGGEEALDRLNSLTLLPDIIFMDINMPKMSGFDVLRELKQADHLKHIPVIIYSTTHDNGHVQEAKALGAKDFVKKPTKFSDLCTLLESTFKTLSS